MRRLFCMILVCIVCFVATGCSTEVDYKETNIKDPTSSEREQNLWMYEDEVYFGCSHGDTPKIFKIGLERGSKAVLLNDAYLYGIFGSLLVAKQNSNFQAKKLSDPLIEMDWKIICSLGEGEFITASYESFDRLYLIGNGFYYEVDKNTLQSQRQGFDQEKRKIVSVVSSGEGVYYICTDSVGGTLCHKNKKGEIQEISKVRRDTTLHLYETRLFCQSAFADPFVYDIVDQTITIPTKFKNGYNSTVLMKNIAVSTTHYEEGRIWIYDIMADKELSATDIGLDCTQTYTHILPNGFVYFSNATADSITAVINGKTYMVDLSDSISSENEVTKIQMNEFGLAFMTNRKVVTICWSDQVVREIYH